MNWPLFIKLCRDLKQRISILFALVLVLAVGVSSYVSMAGIYNDLNGARANYYHKYKLADFTLDIKRAPEASTKLVDDLPNIFRLRSRLKVLTMVTLPEKSYFKLQQAIPGEVLSLPVPRQNIINDVKLFKGRWFSSPYAREVIVDQQFANARKLLPGDKIKVRLPDKRA